MTPHYNYNPSGIDNSQSKEVHTTFHTFDGQILVAAVTKAGETRDNISTERLSQMYIVYLLINYLNLKRV